MNSSARINHVTVVVERLNLPDKTRSTAVFVYNILLW